MAILFLEVLHSQ